MSHKSPKSVVKLLASDPTPDQANTAGDVPATGLRHLGLFVSNLEEVVADVVAAGCVIAIPITEFQPGARFAFVEDPEDNRIELLDIAALAD